MTKQHFICFILLLCISFTANAQVCTRKITPQSIAEGNFDLNYNNSGGAEIQDKTSGLVWQRCVYGQQWDGVKCDGQPIKVTWQEALKSAIAQGWRVPDIKELSTILDMQCISPPFHPDIFPNMPASEENGLWSSTPYVISQLAVGGQAVETNAWWVELMFGSMSFRPVSTFNFVIFVR